MKRSLLGIKEKLHIVTQSSGEGNPHPEPHLTLYSSAGKQFLSNVSVEAFKYALYAQMWLNVPLLSKSASTPDLFKVLGPCHHFPYFLG